MLLTVTQPFPAHIVKRLAFVRFLHQQGVEQTHLPYPLSSTAILSFHDAVELFYVVALDYLGVQVNPKTPFDEYWPKLAAVAPNLSGRRGMERLNRDRVSLKHHASLPGTRQVADARTDVDAFLAANTQVVLAVDWDSITMADVISQPAIRAKLKNALSAEGAGDRGEAMALLAEAFDGLFNPQNYAHVKRSPLAFGETLAWPRRLAGHEIGAILTWLRGDSKGGGYRDPRPLADQIAAVTEVAAATQAALRVLSLGVEYPRYLRFQQLTPLLTMTIDGRIHRSYPNGYSPSRDDFDYCHQFVVDVAMRVAEVGAYLEPPSWSQQTP